MKLFHFFRLTVAIVFLLAVQISGANALSNGGDIIKGWIADAQDSDFFQITSGNISYDASSRTVTANDLEFSFKITPKLFSLDSQSVETRTGKEVKYIIRFPAVSFHNLQLSGGVYSVDAIDADVAKVEFSMPSNGDNMSTTASYEGIAVRQLSWNQMPRLDDDAAHPASRFYPLVKAVVETSYKSVIIKNLEQVQIFEKSGLMLKTTYGQMSVLNMVRGNVEKIVVSGISVKTSFPGPDRKNDSLVTINKISTDNYNAGTFIRNFAPGISGGPDAPYKIFVDNMTLSGLSFTFRDGHGTVDRMIFEDLGVRPTQVSALKMLDKLILLGKTDRKSKPDPQLIADLLASTYGAMRAGNIEINNFAFDVKGDASGSLKQFAIRDLSAAGMKQLLLSALSFKSQKDDTEVHIGNYGLEDLGFPPMSALVGFNAAQKRGDVEAMLKAMPTLSRVFLNGIFIKAAGKEAMSLKSAETTMSHHIGPIPTVIKAEMKKMIIPLSLMKKKDRRELEEMGYKTLDISYDIALGWDETSKILSLALKGLIADAGAVEMKAELGGLPRLAFENPGALPGLAFAMSYIGADAKFTDYSIVDRAIKLQADNQNIQPDMLRQQLVGMVPFALQKFGNVEFTKTVTRAVRTLLSGEKNTIAITARPANPIPAVNLIAPAQTDPGSLIDLLGVQVQTH
jgi:hypothetical protein